MARGEYQRHRRIGGAGAAPVRGLHGHAAEPFDAAALHRRHLGQRRRVVAARQGRLPRPGQPVVAMLQAVQTDTFFSFLLEHPTWVGNEVVDPDAGATPTAPAS